MTPRGRNILAAGTFGAGTFAIAHTALSIETPTLGQAATLLLAMIGATALLYGMARGL